MLSAALFRKVCVKKRGAGQSWIDCEAELVSADPVSLSISLFSQSVTFNKSQTWLLEQSLALCYIQLLCTYVYCFDC